MHIKYAFIFGPHRKVLDYRNGIDRARSVMCLVIHITSENRRPLASVRNCMPEWLGIAQCIPQASGVYPDRMLLCHNGGNIRFYTRCFGERDRRYAAVSYVDWITHLVLAWPHFRSELCLERKLHTKVFGNLGAPYGHPQYCSCMCWRTEVQVRGAQEGRLNLAKNKRNI